MDNLNAAGFNQANGGWLDPEAGLAELVRVRVPTGREFNHPPPPEGAKPPCSTRPALVKLSPPGGSAGFVISGNFQNDCNVLHSGGVGMPCFSSGFWLTLLEKLC